MLEPSIPVTVMMAILGIVCWNKRLYYERWAASEAGAGLGEG